jgi:hypothetical protein
MKYFHRGRGADPYFRHRFSVKIFTEEMYEWCDSYPLDGCCERWHVEWARAHGRNYDVVQMESKKAAYLFKIAFSEYILHD